MEGSSTAQQQQYEYAHTQSVPSDASTTATAAATGANTAGNASVSGGASRSAGVGVTDGGSSSGSTKAMHLQKAPADGMFTRVYDMIL